jgi:hypothetical protein
VTRLIERVRRHPVVAYFVLAYAVSWSVWIPMALANVRVRQGDPWPTHVFGLVGPAVAAVVMTAVLDGRAAMRDLLTRTVRWRADPVSYLAALSPIGLFVLAALTMAATGRGWPDLSAFTKFSGYQPSLLGCCSCCYW